MNILITDAQQVLYTENWLQKMNINFTHSGNNMSEEAIADLNSKIEMLSLFAYRAAVARQTREILSSMKPGQFKIKVDPNRIKRLFDENAVSQSASWLADYWSKKNIAGLILMPATRHNFLHLNKSIRIKDKLQKQKIGAMQ